MSEAAAMSVDPDYDGLVIGAGGAGVGSCGMNIF
jgi:hypothetical protein